MQAEPLGNVLWSLSQNARALSRLFAEVNSVYITITIAKVKRHYMPNSDTNILQPPLVTTLSLYRCNETVQSLFRNGITFLDSFCDRQKKPVVPCFAALFDARRESLVT